MIVKSLIVTMEVIVIREGSSDRTHTKVASKL